jgi:hypothetical protein
MRIKRLLAASFAAALLASGVAGPAGAARQTIGDGLVNVQVGDITIRDINVAAAVDAVVQACPNVDATVVAGIIALIDAGDAKQTTFCEVEDGKGTTKIRP